MSTPNVGRRSAGLALAAVLCLAACTDRASSAGETVGTPAATAAPTTAAPTTVAPTTTAAPTTTVEVTTTDEAREPIVLKGAWSFQHPRIELPSGAVTESVALDGDVVGQGAFLGSATPDGADYNVEGDWVFHLRSPELGEGLIAVQRWDGLATPTDFNGTGEVTGLSGAFADMTGTISVTLTGTDPERPGPANYAPGTYVIELQPAAPSPDPAEPTETRTIEFETTPVGAWLAEPAFGGGSATTGDVVGSQGWTGNTTDGAAYQIVVGTLDGEGEGVFVARSDFTSVGETYTADSEFFGISGAFAGLRGEGTETGKVHDETGAFAPAATFTFEVSR